jgi:hypothetical protein
VRVSAYLPRNARALMRARQLGGRIKYLSQGATGKVLLDGEQPVGCALLCSKSLRQRLAAPLLVALGLGDRTR